MKALIAPRPILIAVLLVVAFGNACSGPDSSEVTFVAVGDIMLGRHIGKVISRKGNPSPFEKIRPVLQKSDILFGNLESVIGENYTVPNFQDKPYNFIAHPRVVGILKGAGFSVLSLANNHAMDFGAGALSETRRLLKEQGIADFGAGTNINDARRPTELSRGGLRFGFLGYGVAHSREAYATTQRAGLAPFVMEEIQQDIQDLRKRVDVLIVSLHWGIEYETAPSGQQRAEAHQIIDWGADMIIGHHPHVLQGVELYKGKLIAYSLGNFLFDQKHNGTGRGAMLVCSFRKNAPYSAEIVPLDRYHSYFPMIATGEAAEHILKEMKAMSAPLNADAGALSSVGLK